MRPPSAFESAAKPSPAPTRCEMAIPKLNDKGRMSDIPLSPEAKITVERRGEIVLIGVNRPQAGNRFDPDAFFGLAKAYYDFDNDPSLRAAVFFGHGENFSRGIDVDAFAPLARTGKPFAIKDGMLDPFARFPREAGWGNAMRYMLTGDHWGAEEALRMGVIQQIAPNPAQALE